MRESQIRDWERGLNEREIERACLASESRVPSRGCQGVTLGQGRTGVHGGGLQRTRWDASQRGRAAAGGAPAGRGPGAHAQPAAALQQRPGRPGLGRPRRDRRAHPVTPRGGAGGPPYTCPDGLAGLSVTRCRGVKRSLRLRPPAATALVAIGAAAAPTG